MACRPIALACIVGTALCSACLFPNDPVTGLELSWFSGEANLVDAPSGGEAGEAGEEGEEGETGETGETGGDGGDSIEGDGRRIRTCDGGLYSRVEFVIRDLDRDDRERRFGYECDRGYLTPEQFLISASPVFIELRPGRYEVAIEAIDDPSARGEQGGEIKRISEGLETITVNDAGPTFLQWEVIPLQGQLTLEFSGACDFISLSLAYADPVEDLAEFAFGAEPETDDPIIYRENLVASTGLPLTGTAANCMGLNGLDHIVRDLDRGDYTLWVSIDDAQPCPVDVRIEDPETTLSVDLDALGCAP